MKKKDIQVGRIYQAMVSGNLTSVRIDRESPYGGWEATNLTTKRSVRIRSAQRLRRDVTKPAEESNDRFTARLAEACAREEEQIRAMFRGEITPADGSDGPESLSKLFS